MDDYRIEYDTLGAVKIPDQVLWGPQTQRSLQNFKAGKTMPLALIRVLIQLKKAAAQANYELYNLDATKSNLIVQACDQLLALEDNELQKHFPLKIYQTGSGTQTNMNVNEVIAHVAQKLDSQNEILPNDDVNRGQSSNDIFPTAMNIAARLAVAETMLAVKGLIAALKIKQSKYWQTVKIGRTHLQDATPLTFGQEISGWTAMLEHDLLYLEKLEPTLNELAIGGTAVGTGLNAVPGFAQKVAKQMAEIYGVAFSADGNKFYGLAAHSGLNVVHGALKTLAADLLKIANDIRFLASGPRAGYGELKIPANEPGSSIMPGKVNPTQCEALTMASVRVMGNDVVVNMASSQGNFEMNVYKPVLIDAFLESADLLTETIQSFNEHLIQGLEVNEKRMQSLVDYSLMTVTALAPHIGYHESAKIAQLAEKEGLTLKEAALKSGKVTKEQYRQWMDPLKMTNID